MKYGKGIRLIRATRGMSQKDLAASSDLDKSYISLIETGSRTPSMAVLETIATALRVPVYLLILLGSEEADLRGITQDYAAELGRQLLRTLTESEKEAGP